MCNMNTVIIIITINVKKKILSSLKADFWSKVKVVETRPFIVVLNYSLWSEHDKHFTFLNIKTISDTSALVSSCYAAIWTLSRADKRSVCCTSNE